MSAKKPSSFKLDRLTIFIEGKGAKNFFENFTAELFPDLALACEFRGFQSDVDFINLDTALLAWWEQVQRQSAPNTTYKFLVITDADADSDIATAKAETIVRETKEKVDAQLLAHYKILITPGNGSNALEASLLQSVNNNFVSVKKCAEVFAKCVEAHNPKDKPFAKQNWTDKVIVHAMLAASENPEIPLWDKKSFQLWDPTSPELKRIFDTIEAFVVVTPI
jgi:hypothetical protein